MIRKYYLLAKPGIIFGNAVTALGGFALASKGHIDFLLLLMTLLGLSLIVGAGCVFNNYLDRLSDKKMARTKNRPLAKGTISIQNANIYGATLLILGSAILTAFTNLLSVTIALAGFVIYVLFYTILKHKTVYGTAIGSVAGAVPPVVGYVAVTNHLDLAALLLFLIVTLWQMPHFFAIAMYRIDDYVAASIPVLPIKKGNHATKIRMLFYISVFTVMAAMLVVFGYAGYSYLLATLILGAYWLWVGVKGFKALNDKIWARKMFVSSLVVIMGLCAMISFDYTAS